MADAVELLEREELLAELRQAAADAAGGGGRMVVLEGESGVGKSSVLRALAARTAGPVRVLWGACDALATPRPLGPLADMASRGAEATAAALAARAPIHDIFDAFLRDLGSPSVAVLEDLHWADEATLDLLRFVGRRVRDTRSLLLGSLRADELDPTHPLTAVLGDLATLGVLRRRIEPLSTESVRRLAHGHDVDPAELHRITGGNAFYVTEVLAAPGAAVPLTVRDAVLARAGRLSGEARDLLELASLEPGGVERALLRALGVADRAVDEAVRAAVLIDDGHVLRFRHDLARLAVGSSLAPETASRLHGQLLDVMGPRADPARMAHHARASGRPGATLRWSQEAGDTALRASAHRQAAEHYATAVEHIGLLGEREAAHLLGRFAEALTAIDQQDRAVEAWERATVLLAAGDDVVARLWARAQLARGLWTAGRSVDAYAVIDETVRELETVTGAQHDSRAAEAYALAAYMAMLARRSGDAVPWARRSIAVAEASASRDALPLAYNALGCARIIGFEDLGGVDDLERSRTIAQELGDRRSVIGAYSNTGSALGEVRRYQPAAEALERAVEYALAHDFDYAGRYALAWLGRIRFEQGRWAEAEAIASSIPRDEASSPISLMVALVVHGRICARRGLPYARGLLEEAWAIAKRTNDVQRTWPAIVGIAEAAWLEGWKADDVASVLDRLASVLAEARELRLTWAVGELAFWLDRLGGPSVDRTGAAPPFAASLAGQHGAAAKHWTTIGCPYEAAWARSDADDEPSLRLALATLMSLGADPLAGRVRRRLRERGATGIPIGPRRSTASAPSGLTSRESEVLTLLVQGLTDAEIAERLVISPRTASHHVSAILMKLGVHRRSQAAAAAYGLGFGDAKDG